jgi:uncharacterized protein (TIGR03435 family)
MKRIFLAMMSTLILIFIANAQQLKYPRVGDTLADHTFTDLKNYGGKSLSIKEFRGKWLILDVWDVHCVSCVRKMPGMDSLEQRFKDKLKVVIVGISDEKYRKNEYDIVDDMIRRYKLKSTFAHDKSIQEICDINSVPMMLVVNPDGIIVEKTMGVNSEQFTALLNGEKVKFDRAYSASEPIESNTYKINIPLLTSGAPANGGNDTGFVFRSVLTKPTDGMPYVMEFDTTNEASKKLIQQGRVEILHGHLKDLYFAAYFGVNRLWKFDDRRYDTLYPNFVWNAKAKLDLKSLWAYSLSAPATKSNSESLMKMMRNDLENYFGVKARTEIRKVPVYYMEVDDKVKFNTLKAVNSEGKMVHRMEFTKMHFENCPMYIFSRVLSWYMKLDIPVFNNSDYNGKITMDFISTMADPQNVRDNLKNYGLKLTKGEKEMKVVVIEDFN